jgi:hypothetical protein
MPRRKRSQKYTSDAQAAKTYRIPRQRVADLRARGVCDLCGVSLPTDPPYVGSNIDHDHATGAVRGLLCARCNVLVVPVVEREGKGSDPLDAVRDWLAREVRPQETYLGVDKDTYRGWVDDAECHVCRRQVADEPLKPLIDYEVGQLVGLACVACARRVLVARDWPLVLRARRYVA